MEITKCKPGRAPVNSQKMNVRESKPYHGHRFGSESHRLHKGFLWEARQTHLLKPGSTIVDEFNAALMAECATGNEAQYTRGALVGFADREGDHFCPHHVGPIAWRDIRDGDLKPLFSAETDLDCYECKQL